MPSEHIEPLNDSGYIDPDAEARTIDEARAQMVVELHQAFYGVSCLSRQEPPAVVWAELIEAITYASRQFHRRG